MPTIDIDRIRSDLEEFTSAVDEEYYLNGAGLKDKAEFSRIYEKFSHLFNKEVIDYVQRYSKSVTGEEERRVRYLRAFLINDYMENRVKELSDKFLTMEAETTVNVQGETLPFRQSAVIMANERTRDRRASIFQARNKVIETFNLTLKERMLTLHKTAGELGYPDYAALYEDTKGIELRSLERVLKPFLDDTRVLYSRLMGELLETKIGAPLSEAEKHDISVAFRANEFDHFFKKENTVQTLVRTLAGMGIDLKGQKNIRLDVEERPKKSPRAFVSPIKVPLNIRLVIMPQGGHDDYATLFHEA